MPDLDWLQIALTIVGTLVLAPIVKAIVDLRGSRKIVAELPEARWRALVDVMQEAFDKDRAQWAAERAELRSRISELERRLDNLPELMADVTNRVRAAEREDCAKRVQQAREELARAYVARGGSAGIGLGEHKPQPAEEDSDEDLLRGGGRTG